MKLQDAILKSLDEIGSPATYKDVYTHIKKNGYYDFGDSKTPDLSVSGTLTALKQKGDSRIGRIKSENGVYLYYLTKNEQKLDDDISSTEDTQADTTKSKNSQKRTTPLYKERSLHPLLASYLKSDKIYSKTIFHERSTAKQGEGQTWTHPDMVGVKFINLKTKTSKDLLKSVNKSDLFKISSYELKTEINNDSELKSAYFQAVSNSSWANYGYLVAYEFSDALRDEMERLNQSFGIGIIKLDSYPYWSEIIYPARHRELDFKMIDKLCGYSPEFMQFVEQTEKLITADERYYSSSEREFDGFCDECLETDEEIDKYLSIHKIPPVREA